MKVECVSCGHEISLDHWVFDDYEGPVKCFSCSRMMEVKTAQGIVQSLAPLDILKNRRYATLGKTRH